MSLNSLSFHSANVFESNTAVTQSSRCSHCSQHLEKMKNEKKNNTNDNSALYMHSTS
jgi:uncharacterized protein with PIN domain